MQNLVIWQRYTTLQITFNSKIVWLLLYHTITTLYDPDKTEFNTVQGNAGDQHCLLFQQYLLTILRKIKSLPPSEICNMERLPIVCMPKIVYVGPCSVKGRLNASLL